MTLKKRVITQQKGKVMETPGMIFSCRAVLLYDLPVLQ